MNKKINVILALSMLLCAVPAQSISHNTATALTALTAPVNFLISWLAWNTYKGEQVAPSPCAGSDTEDVLPDPTRSQVKKNQNQSRGNGLVAPVAGAAALTAATYTGLYQFTPAGRCARANKIIESVKDELPRLHLGADQISSSFVDLNEVKKIDSVIRKLKEAESLLLAAKKDIYPEASEWCKIQAQNLYAQVYARIKETSAVEVGQAKNHREIGEKIDASLAQVQVMLSQLAEVCGSGKFLKQLKAYEALRAQNKRSSAINLAVATGVVVGAVYVVNMAVVSITALNQ